MGVTWINGRLVDDREATVPFLTAALHYGIGVFEGIRCYDTPAGLAVFRLTDHLERLVASARVLGFRQLPYDVAALTAAVRDLVAANRLRACYIRPLIYLAEGGMNLSIDSGRPHVGIAAWPWQDYHGAAAADSGIRLNVASIARHHPNVMPTRAKVCGNYVNSFMAKTESMRLGFDDAVMLDAEGYVAECTAENIFLVRGGRVLTPPAGAILDGLTRQSVMTLAADAGLAVVEQRLVRDQLYDAEEIFITGTAAEVVAVREIDFRAVGAGAPGPVTRQLQQAYRRAVTGEHPRSAGWLTMYN